ncbi:MAG: M48 family metalloprotease [Thermoguttaceae bacterium]|jgi:Zn-dependent protease with chaperone function
MNVFERQDKARSYSMRLMFLMILAIFGVIFTFHAIIASLYYLAVNESFSELFEASNRNFFIFLYYLLIRSNLKLFVINVTAVGGTILCGYLVRLFKLRKGGVKGIVLSIGGRRVKKGALNMRDRRLYNVVEEIALSSGIPMPRVFILDNVRGINACAVGLGPERAGICVTQGALDRLTRDELQCVVAHEFSHIVNRDVGVNMRTLAVLGGLEWISDFGYWLAGNPQDEADDLSYAWLRWWGGGSFVYLMLGGFLIALGSLGHFAGRLIRAAICRQRELLADASAVQYTLNPEGLASALKKIGCRGVGSEIDSPSSAQLAHLFFGSVSRTEKLLQTHPSLVKRIKALEPTFDGTFPDSVGYVSWDIEGEPYSAGYTGALPPPPSVDGAPKRRQAPSKSKDPSLSEVFARKKRERENAEKRLRAQHEINRPKLKIAPSLLAPLPDNFANVVATPIAARAAVYCFLINAAAPARERQRELLEKKESSEIMPALNRIYSVMKSIPPPNCLTLLQETAPALRNETRKEYRKFRKLVNALIASDDRMDFFEFALQQSLLRDLDVYFKLKKERKPRYARFTSIDESFRIVALALAYEGNRDQETAEKAFREALDVFHASAETLKSRQYTLQGFFNSLERLALAVPQLKKPILAACWRCVLYDGVVTERESALMCALTAALGEPFPVWRDLA